MGPLDEVYAVSDDLVPGTTVVPVQLLAYQKMDDCIESHAASDCQHIIVVWLLEVYLA